MADYPYVGLETGGGARGCAYALVGTEADLSYPLFCWGTPAFLLSETTRVNVRVDFDRRRRRDAVDQLGRCKLEGLLLRFFASVQQRNPVE